jgi:5-methylcytosine-specific restriction endonuclease McrA
MIPVILLACGFIVIVKAVQNLTDELYPGNDFPPAVRKAMIREHCNATGGQCPECCGMFSRNALDVVHIVPLHRGGLNSRNNALVLCATCQDHRSHRVTLLDRLSGRSGTLARLRAQVVEQVSAPTAADAVRRATAA